MKKTMLALALTLTLGIGIGYNPSAASADDGAELAQAAMQASLGTIETAAVTGPISFVDITYIPCGSAGCDASVASNPGATGGGSGSVEFLGTIETAAVTGPISFGAITYIPMSAEQHARLAQ